MPMMKLQSKHEQSGFSLIEVLVTLLIIAVGLLSIAALQFKGLQYNQDAYMRSQINFLAYDIADRLRLNRDNAADYVANYTVPAAKPAGCDENAGVDAVNDLLCWRTQVYYALPPTSLANITAAGSMYTVALAWTDREGTTRNIEYTFQL
ncbi:MAG: type IV pilus modification protein PilV [Gammaproteobacteria bacterium RIFCSPLOWO2_01_FULL_47_190]|nr:MAG: type IV pilus modification protein PilV [Gammaproteobacteria bacterium RIFCSPLOWO2_01_FULL_47_190]OGT74964.1 MAG: type IV pilus modification protein PilV [Gammaproteobacteria bacterium RIFCSPLOWO2_12_47_11]OGT87601.1 MAG: type IV pilus modification protein PilV [Gammaproteobacteria bacterium RIFCSPLOWO2_12_FULL_47_76]